MYKHPENYYIQPPIQFYAFEAQSAEAGIWLALFAFKMRRAQI
jgi:hypothetical protein